MKKRMGALLLAAAMVFQTGSLTALAQDTIPGAGAVVCTHHLEHTLECGYVEEVPGTPCSHEHTDDCYTNSINCIHVHTADCYPDGDMTGEPSLCTHVCTEESGCVARSLDCHHEHDANCGYTKGIPGSPCTFVCAVCGGQTKCICTSQCGEGAVNAQCPVCGAEGVNLAKCTGAVKVAAAAPRSTNSISVCGVKVDDGEYLANGDDAPSSTPPASGGYAYYSQGVLTLHNAEIVDDNVDGAYAYNDGIKSAIYSSNDLTLVLEGTNTVTGCDRTIDRLWTHSFGIYVFGTLTITASSEGDSLKVAGGEVNRNGVFPGSSGGIKAESVTISGGTVEACGKFGDVSSFGIRAESSIEITGGNVTASSDTAKEEDSYGMSLQDTSGSITISGGTGKATCGASQNGEKAQAMDRAPEVNNVVAAGAYDSTEFTWKNGSLYMVEYESGISQVPETLKDNEKLNTPEKIEAAMQAKVIQLAGGLRKEHTAVYDVTLLVSFDGGKTWEKATEENFPAEGLTITLPYPTGTGRTTHDFVAAHMVTSAALGKTPGSIETPVVTKTASGLQFTVTGLSPVAVGWKEVSSGGGSHSSERDDGEHDFWTQVKEQVEQADSNTLIKVDAQNYDKMPWTVMRALEKNDKVSMVVRWNGGQDITIPAGGAQSTESSRIYFPLSLLEELYGEHSSTGTGKPAEPGKPNPSTGGVLEITAPCAGSMGVAETPELAAKGVEQAIPGVYEPDGPANKSAALAVLGAAVLGGILLTKRKTGESAR